MVWMFDVNQTWVKIHDALADSRFVLSQWETSLQSNGVSHWHGLNLESALWYTRFQRGQDILSHIVL